MIRSRKTIYEFGPFRLDGERNVLLRNGVEIFLSRPAFELLLYFVLHPGEPISKSQLLGKVWPNTVVEEGRLVRSIYLLRRALNQKPEATYIETLRGRYYRFVPAVKEVLAPEEIRGAPENSIAAETEREAECVAGFQMSFPDRSYAEIVDLFARTSRAEVLDFRPSVQSQQRVHYLLERNRNGELNEDETAELERFTEIEHLMQLVKARAHNYAGSRQ
jgi:DNA-binding winged helix-turn-helix (wHTH) protein